LFDAIAKAKASVDFNIDNAFFTNKNRKNTKSGINATFFLEKEVFQTFLHIILLNRIIFYFKKSKI